jgi:membrane protease YdiL (CAAX protease family)
VTELPETPAAEVRTAWGLGDVAIAFGGWFVLSVLAVAMIAGLPQTPTGKGLGVVVGVVLPWVALVGWPWVVARTRGSGVANDFGWRITWSDVPLGILGGFVSLLLAAGVGAITRHFFGSFNSAAGEVAGTLTGHRLWLAIFAVLIAFGAPVVEELAFRGMLFSALLKRGVSARRTTVLVAITFAIFHFEWIRLPLLLVIGLVLGYLRERTGRVGASVVAHSVNNIIGALSLLSP